MTRADRTEAGEPPPEQEEAFRLFRQRFYRARAEIEREMVGVLGQVARGGTLIEETTRTQRDGSVEETRKYQAPDWRAAELHLRHTIGREWSKSTETVALRLEDGTQQAGVGGGQGTVTEAAQVAQNVRSHIDRARESLAIEAAPEQGIEDAVVVEDERVSDE